MKWQAISPQSLHMRAWGEEVVVYDARTGDTHLLALAAARILAAIGHSPANVSSLAQTLTDLLPDQNSQEQAHEQIEAMLAELAGISLITPAKP